MFRFTIRDVLWLTVLAAVLVAWWIDRSRVSRDRAELQTQVLLLERFGSDLQDAVVDLVREKEKAGQKASPMP